MLKINRNTRPNYEEDSTVGEKILNTEEMKRIFDILAKKADKKKDCLYRM